MVNFQYYDPKNIFQDDSNPRHMAGKTNVKLAASFCHSREVNGTGSHECNTGCHHRQFNRNAGAIQLYREDGISIYTIPGTADHKEYHYISYGNKNFKIYTKKDNNCKASSYGHSERMLMRDILDDLIFYDKTDKHDILRPSDELHCRSTDVDSWPYEILKYLTNNPTEYKEYLESKNIIVKMWSERPACTEKSNIGMVGSDCTTFMRNICPKDSQFGYIIESYHRGDTEEVRNTLVKDAFTAFEKAYRDYCAGSRVLGGTAVNGELSTPVKNDTA